MFKVSYFDGHTPRRWPVNLRVDGKQILIEGIGWSRRVSREDIEIPDRKDATTRQLNFANGARCEFADAADLAGILADIGAQRPKSESFRHCCGVSVLSLASLATLIWVAYLWGLPLLFKIAR